jgi:hypothetical protein
MELRVLCIYSKQNTLLVVLTSFTMYFPGRNNAVHSMIWKGIYVVPDLTYRYYLS